LYRQGKVTLRDAAALLNLNQIETIDLLLDAGISGNLDATDVLTSLRKFG
jgi:predicted HTH domain antitoxin